MKIHFEKIQLPHQTLIFEWLNKPHVREFWDNSPEHRQDILAFLKGREEPSDHLEVCFTYWIGSIDSVPYCFLLTSEVCAEQEGLPEHFKAHLSQTGKAFTLDFCIGNTDFLGKGLAAPTLTAFMDFFQQQVENQADAFFIDPADHNARAKHVYAKAGFQSVGEFTPTQGAFQGIIHKLMLKRLPAPAAPHIDLSLVHWLVSTQFPQWAELPIKPVAVGGWDNRTFHLGEHMLVRMPSGEEYADKVEKEQTWLPRLAPHLSLPIPHPLAMGKPGEGYPWKWSIYRWIEGETAASGSLADLEAFARDLARFLLQFQSLDTTGGPRAQPGNFSYIGGLAVYDEETRRAIAILKDKIDACTAMKVWEIGLETQWQAPPVWVHGDISSGNLLVRDGKLSAVIDFGGLAVGATHAWRTIEEVLAK